MKSESKKGTCVPKACSTLTAKVGGWGGRGREGVENTLLVFYLSFIKRRKKEQQRSSQGFKNQTFRNGEHLGHLINRCALLRFEAKQPARLKFNVSGLDFGSL